MDPVRDCAAAPTTTTNALTPRLLFFRYTAGDGQTFFYHQTPGEYTWETPKELEAQDKAAEGGGAAAAAAAYAGPWSKHNDQNSGMSFWYNSETGDSSWEKPEEVPDESARHGDGEAAWEVGEDLDNLF